MVWDEGGSRESEFSLSMDGRMDGWMDWSALSPSPYMSDGLQARLCCVVKGARRGVISVREYRYEAV